MSFILDALRKSEAERQQKNAPGIASIPQGGGARSGPRWMWLAVGLLLVNLAVLSGVLLKMNGDESQRVADNPPSTPSSVAADPLPKPAGDAPVPATTVAGALPDTGARSAVDTQLVPAESGINANDPPAAAIPLAEARTVNEAASAVPAPTPATPPQVLASFNDLRASGVLNLPDLHLDIHVYSGQPDERFVFVNMAKYRENATLSEGPVVQEITPDGVILDYRGTDFLLPRE